VENMTDIKYLKDWNKDLEIMGDEQEAIEVHNRCIQALKFNVRAKELLEACVKLLNKQSESPYVLNLLDELIYYDECECDGNCLLEDIENLLECGE
jgi:hypothetical protein